MYVYNIYIWNRYGKILKIVKSQTRKIKFIKSRQISKAEEG